MDYQKQEEKIHGINNHKQEGNDMSGHEEIERKGAMVFIAVETLTQACHGLAHRAGWWNDLKTGEDMRGKRNFGELIALCHSELSEALEAHRKDKMDDHLPHRKGAEVELADALIRICDLAGGYGLDLAGAVTDKLAYNSRRSDHKLEARRAEGGKAY